MILLGFEIVAVGIVVYYIFKGSICSEQSQEQERPYSEEVPPPYREVE